MIFFFEVPQPTARGAGGEGAVPGAGSRRPGGTRLCPGPGARARGAFAWECQGLGAGNKRGVEAGVVPCRLLPFMSLLPWGVRVGDIALFN